MLLFFRLFAFYLKNKAKVVFKLFFPRVAIAKDVNKIQNTLSNVTIATANCQQQYGFRNTKHHTQFTVNTSC